MRNLLKKPILLKGNADWLRELRFILETYNNTIQSSIKKTPNQACKKANEKEIYFNLQDGRDKQDSKFDLGPLVRTVDNKRVFINCDGTNWSYKLYTKTEIIYDTIASFRINYLPKRYNENLLGPTKLTLDESNQVKKELNLIQKYTE